MTRQGVAYLFGPPAGDRMAARRAVPVATQEATGIDSRATCGGLGFSAFFLSVNSGFGPAPGPGRLPGAGQGAGACQPLAPYNPYPAFGQPLLAGSATLQAHPASLADARHWASPFRCPARGTSVRAASELPRLRRGDLLRAMTR